MKNLSIYQIVVVILWAVCVIGTIAAVPGEDVKLWHKVLGIVLLTGIAGAIFYSLKKKS